MGRGMQLAIAAAAVVGSTAGTLAALRTNRTAKQVPTVTGSDGSQTATTPTPAKQTPVEATPPPSVPPPPHEVFAAQLRAMFVQFAEWSPEHAGAACPMASDLAVHALDPWGRPIEVTCTDQPADQIIGAISLGPDGVAGTADDVASWTLGRSVTDLVRGPRWRSVAGAVSGKRTKRPPPTTSTGTPRSTTAPATDVPHDDIPSRR